MDIEKLKNEIDVDSLSRGYVGMTNAEITADGHIKYRSRNKTSLTGSEIFNAIPEGVLGALPIEDQVNVWRVIHIGDINPFGAEVFMFTSIFGSQSATITALKALRVESISRWDELGMNVKEGHIERARG